MQRIVVRDELGDNIVTRDHGRRLRTLLERGLASPPVVIDFGGLQITSVSFFDEAFGNLARRYGERLLSLIQLERIDPFDQALVRDIIHSRAEESRKRAAG